MKLSNNQIILLFACVLSAPIFFFGIKGHDAVNHLITSRLFAEQFFSGDLYPRWIFKAENGFGSPILYHFPTLHYFISLVFYPLNFLEPTGRLVLFTTATLAMVCSGLFANLYLKQITDQKTALFGALLYLSLPHHLTDLYIRFAFSELWAIALLPLCLYFVQKKSLAGLAFSFAALIVAHAITFIIFTPVLLGLIILRKDFKLLLSLALGIGLSAFYLYPAISNRDLVTLQVGIASYDFRNNFFDMATTSKIYYSLGLIPVIVTLILARKQVFEKLENSYWLLVTAAAMFMTFPISLFIWETIPQLANLYYPWRFMTVILISATILFTLIPKRFQYLPILLSLILSVPALVSKNSEDPEKYLKHNMITIDDFRTKWTDQALVADGHYKTADKLEKLKTQITYGVRSIAVKVKEPGLVTIPHFYFPYFSSEYEITPQPGTGLMQVNAIKPGLLQIDLNRSDEEIIGFKTSAISLLLLTAILSFIRKRKFAGH